MRPTAPASASTTPTAALVELAEFLTARIRGMDWALFGKNGSDMTSFALQVAREHTGRRTVLKAAGAYHGSYPWASPGHAGLIAEDRAHLHDFTWNDRAGMEALVAAHAHDLAAVLVTPYHHPLFRRLGVFRGWVLAAAVRPGAGARRGGDQR